MYLEDGLNQAGNAREAIARLRIDADDREARRTLFRAFHTFKGNADLVNRQDDGEVAREALALVKGEKPLGGVELDLVGGALAKLEQTMNGIAQRLAAKPTNLAGDGTS
jgi:chemotaxis protein histidine kinase CheA